MEAQGVCLLLNLAMMVKATLYDAFGDVVGFPSLALPTLRNRVVVYHHLLLPLNQRHPADI